jgi:hypothetical protein
MPTNVVTMPPAASAVATWLACATASGDLRAPNLIGRAHGTVCVTASEAFGSDLCRHSGSRLAVSPHRAANVLRIGRLGSHLRPCAEKRTTSEDASWLRSELG